MAVLRNHSVMLPVRVVFTEGRIGGLTLLSSARRQKLPAALAGQLCRYFGGQPVTVRAPLDLSGGTPFQRKVWRALQTIPYGQTRSYAWIARKIGQPNAVRAVGSACGANPIPIIVPCHRVVRSDGGLGGFSAGLGWKKRLLALERSR
jgi:O-6-methylguanine DNA methyltransferase